MHASFRSSSSTFFVLCGTAALVVLVVIVLAGGFAFEAGPFRISARRPSGPLLVALLAWTAAALHGRKYLADATASLSARIERAAPAFAIVVAAATAGVGVAYGTYSASGADASGYVSQARLLASGRMMRDEPLVRLVDWPEAGWAFAPLGYRPGPAPGEIVPTYPPGFPLAMAVAHLAGGELAIFLVVPLLGACAVLATYAIGVRLHSRTAGIAAALLLATSPIFVFQLVQPMSDVAATTWWAVALVLALWPLPGAPLAAGATAGFALLTRPNLLPLAAALALITAGWPRRVTRIDAVGWRRLAAFGIGVAPALGGLLLLHWRLYGHPFASGYGAPGELFAFANVWPNARGYAARLLRGEAAALALALTALALLVLPLRRGDEDAWKRAVPPTAVALAIAVVALACYLPYGIFAEWSYLRFLLPAFPTVFVAAGALAAEAAGRVPRPMRALTLVLALAAAVSLNVTRAAREQAYDLRRYEARYRTAGRYLDAMLPSGTVVLAVQESGSAHYYARAPILRWDQLRIDLDAAVAQLVALGRRPILLVESWETDELRRRFPDSALARLDWPPRADFGDDTRVRLFDPSDRHSPRGVITDRLP